MDDPADQPDELRLTPKRRWKFTLPRLVAAIVAAGFCMAVAYPYGRWAYFGATVTAAGFAGIALTAAPQDILPAARLAYGIVVGGILGGAFSIFTSRSSNPSLLTAVVGMMVGAFVVLNPFREDDPLLAQSPGGHSNPLKVQPRPGHWSFSRWRLAIVLVWNAYLVAMVLVGMLSDPSHHPGQIAELIGTAIVVATIVIIPFSALIMHVSPRECAWGSEGLRAGVFALGAVLGAATYGSLFAFLRRVDGFPLKNFHELLIGCFFGGTGGILIAWFAWQHWCGKQKNASP